MTLSHQFLGGEKALSTSPPAMRALLLASGSSIWLRKRTPPDLKASYTNIRTTRSSGLSTSPGKKVQQLQALVLGGFTSFAFLCLDYWIISVSLHSPASFRAAGEMVFLQKWKGLMWTPSTLGNMTAKPASPSWYSWGGLEQEPLGVTAQRSKHEVI